MAQHSSDGRPDNQEHDASQSASLVAMNLISSARVILKLDSVFTEYSAQYVVENATRKKEDRQGGTELKLSVKDCLEYALEEGIPRADCWPHLGCVIKTPSVYKPALVVTKGEVIEGKELEDLFELLEDQPVGAKLHVFSPDIDRRLGEDGIYVRPTSNESCYVGLRDAIVVAVDKIEGKIVARLKICYKKKVSFINVDLTSMFLQGSLVGDESQAIGPTGLLIDFCVPRLSTI